MIRSVKSRAKRDKIPFNLEEGDIQIPLVCPVLGIPLFRGNKHLGPNSPSLDKLIPELGYVKGNVAVISMKANTIKNNATYSEILAVGHWVAAQLSKNL